MLDKKRIKSSFSNAAETYDANSDLQKEVVAELVHLFTHRAANSIGAAIVNAFDSTNNGPVLETVNGRALDIGCGTGAIGRILKGAYPGITVYGCDIAEGMVKKARELHAASSEGQTEKLLCSESEALPFFDSTFDYCFSSLVYQWVNYTETAFKEAWRVLKPGGLLAFSTLGPDTLSELRDSYGAALLNSINADRTERLSPYKPAETLRSELVEAGFEGIDIKRRRIEKRYSNMLELLGRLKKIGAFRRTDLPAELCQPDLSCESKPGSRTTIIKEASRIYTKRFSNEDNSIIATYDVLYFSAIKPETKK